jgi:ACT domain-containing protein
MRERPGAITKVTPLLRKGSTLVRFCHSDPERSEREESAVCRQRHYSRIEVEVHRGFERILLISSTGLLHQDGLPIMNVEGHRWRLALAGLVLGHDIAMCFKNALTRIISNVICLH